MKIMTKGYAKVEITKELLLQALYLDTHPGAKDIDIVGVEYGPLSITLVLSAQIFPPARESVTPPVIAPVFQHEETKLIDWGLPKGDA